MTQSEIDTIFSLVLTAHDHEWFGPNENRRSREEVADWISLQLAKAHGVYTKPCGAGWGLKVSKEVFDKYWKEKSK